MAHNNKPPAADAVVETVTLNLNGKDLALFVLIDHEVVSLETLVGQAMFLEKKAMAMKLQALVTGMTALRDEMIKEGENPTIVIAKPGDLPPH